MKLVKDQISRKKLQNMAKSRFGNLVKAVVDIEKEIMVVDSNLHADEEAHLLTNGSRQENLWGINIYPDLAVDEMIEFDSMINLRPSQGNNTRGVDNPKIQQKIIKIVTRLINDHQIPQRIK